MGNSESVQTGGDSMYAVYDMRGGSENKVESGPSHEDPHHLTKLEKADLSVSTKKLLCNWPDCKMNAGKKAKAERLCPFCHCVGYCCKMCLKNDIDRHVGKECQQCVKKIKIEPKTRLF